MSWEVVTYSLESLQKSLHVKRSFGVHEACAHQGHTWSERALPQALAHIPVCAAMGACALGPHALGHTRSGCIQHDCKATRTCKSEHVRNSWCVCIPEDARPLTHKGSIVLACALVGMCGAPSEGARVCATRPFEHIFGDGHTDSWCAHVWLHAHSQFKSFGLGYFYRYKKSLAKRTPGMRGVSGMHSHTPGYEMCQSGKRVLLNAHFAVTRMVILSPCSYVRFWVVRVPRCGMLTSGRCALFGTRSAVLRRTLLRSPERGRLALRQSTDCFTFFSACRELFSFLVLTYFLSSRIQFLIFSKLYISIDYVFLSIIKIHL